ncbi:MAG: TetR family transcriptional regulator, partial [Sulfuricaulis sp.]|nr:TetR family transcriptional regulator [Sulfuricaulis sp.]
MKKTVAKPKTPEMNTAKAPARATRQDARTREEIVEAAARAFMTRGYDGASLDLVASELGCTKGPIYYRYKSKADLFFDVQ